MPAVVPALASALLAIGAAAAPATTALTPAFPGVSDRQAIQRWLIDTAGFPAGAPTDIGPDSAVVVLTDSTAELREGLHTVTFREEALSVDFVSRTGGRSISGSGSVDCNEGQFRLGAMTVFHGTGLKGERVETFSAQQTWRTPPPASLFQRVVSSVCDAAAPEAPAAPAPAPPVTSEGAGLRGAPQAAAGTVTVQVGAFPGREQAAAGLAQATALASGQMEGRSTEVAAATVNGAQMYRALIHGFATRSQAQAFCAGLVAKGQPCLVRP